MKWLLILAILLILGIIHQMPDHWQEPMKTPDGYTQYCTQPTWDTQTCTLRRNP